MKTYAVSLQVNAGCNCMHGEVNLTQPYSKAEPLVN